MQLRPTLLVCVLLVMMSSASVRTATIQVPTDQATIQQGVDAAAHGDTVLVAPGTYTENIRLKGKRIILTSHYVLSKDTSFIPATIIDGSSPVHPDTASVVMMINGEDARTVVQGFTIQGGAGTRWRDEHGPMFYFREGGGILCAFTSPTIRHNVIRNNIVDNTSAVTNTGGGGIRSGDARPRILSNRFEGNFARYGSAIALNYPTGAVVSGNIVTGNSADGAYGGGAVWINTATITTRVENNTVYGNTSTLTSGGLYNLNGTLTVRNCVLWQNSPANYASSGSTTFLFTITQPLPAGTGNTDGAPSFIDLVNFVPANGSILIDAGDPNPGYNDIEDFGNPGMALYPARGTLRNDMGTYGGGDLDILDYDGDSIIDIYDNCPDNANAGQTDTDGDGFGNACDFDDDNDGRADLSDNCPLIVNPLQSNQDGDTIGDTCDNCPTITNQSQVDTDQDGIGDACECGCLCHGDPICDGQVDITDVVEIIRCAFRNATPIADPNINCPSDPTDVNCTSTTDIVDVVKIVNVAFRAADPGTEFCTPCP